MGGGVIERSHRVWIKTWFKGVFLPRINVLDIHDEFELMDKQLQEMLRMLLDPEIDFIWASGKS